MARWRLASRLARREVVRRPGRTVLVVLLIALPVFGMALASVIMRTSAADDWFSREYGRATDLVVEQSAEGAVDLTGEIPVSATFHQGLWSYGQPIETAGGQIVWAQLAEPDVASSVVDLHGSLPSGADEAWLSAPLLDRLGLDVGDELVLQHPVGTWTIVGSGRSAGSFGQESLVVGELDANQFRPGVLSERTVIDLAPNADDDDMAALLNRIEQVTVGGYSTSLAHQWSGSSGTDVGESLAWGWVIGALALVVTGIIVTAAFATSARRQLATVGLLSSNGAPESTIRRALMLQGSWTGLAGSVLGIGAGLLGAALGRGWIERLTGHALGAYRIAPLDLVIIAVTGVAAATLAALVPALSASRVPVMAALAGRRPLGRVPRRLVPIGLALFAFGVLLLVAATGQRDSNTGAATAIIGGVLVLTGVCCCSPLAVDLMSRATASIGGSWGFAGRSLGRGRTRSAAVVTAIAVAVAAGCVASSAVAGASDDEGPSQWPADAVVAVAYPPATWTAGSDPDAGDVGTVDYGPIDEAPVPPALQEQVLAIVPAGEWHPRQVATWDAPPVPDQGDVVTIDATTIDDTTIDLAPGTSIVVADEATMDLYELSADERAQLGDTGALLLGWSSLPWIWDDVMVSERLEVQIETEAGPLTFPVAVTDDLAAPIPAGSGAMEIPEREAVVGVDTVMMTEEAATAAGLDVVTAGGFLRSTAPLTGDQYDALNSIDWYGGRSALAAVYTDVPMPEGSGGGVSLMYDDPGLRVPRAALQGLVVGGTLVLTLAVVAIGLALAATEGRDERDILIAVGARPRTMRSMAGVKAYVLTVTGVALGVPAGLIPTFAVTRATDEAFRIPWIGVGGLVIAVPAVAGAAAWAASSIAQRVRPVRMSTLVTD